MQIYTKERNDFILTYSVVSSQVCHHCLFKMRSHCHKTQFHEDNTPKYNNNEENKSDSGHWWARSPHDYNAIQPIVTQSSLSNVGSFVLCLCRTLTELE